MNNKQKDNRSQDQDSEHEEDDQDFQLTQKIQKKQLEVDELNKKIRYMELEFKKKEIEINAELANEKQRVEELQDILSKKLTTMKENKEADDLQNRLSLVEDELFEKQQIALDMLRQLTEMEQQNIHLKNEVDRLRNNSSQQDNNSDIDVDKVVNKCLELQKENEELQMEVEQIKRGAIDTIVEKEKMIIDLQEQLEMASSEMKNFENTIHSNNNLMSQEELDNLRNDYEQRIQLYEEKYQEINQRLEQQQHYHDEQLLNLEQQITERVFENMQSHIDSAKSMEADLMHQLQFLEEKTRNQEKMHNDNQKHLSNIKEDFKKEKELLESKIRNLTKQSENFDEISRQLKQISKEFDEYRKQSEREQSEKSNQIEKITLKRDEQMKILVNLESENKRLKENLENSKSNIRGLEEQNEQLREQLEDSQRDIHFKIKELTQQFEKDKFALLEDYQSQIGQAKRKSSGGNQLNKNNSVNQDYVKQNDNNQLNNISRKHSSVSNNAQNNNINDEQSNHIENHIVHFEINNNNNGNNIQNNIENLKNSRESSGKKSSQGGQRISNPKQTLLGMEFEDEDFNIEEEKTDNIENNHDDDQEQLKTQEDNQDQQKSLNDFDTLNTQNTQNGESSSSINDIKDNYNNNNQISTPRKKKKESFNIVESQINPLLPQRNSTRNQFKKQFRFPDKQQQQSSSNQNSVEKKNLLTTDQIARGYNLDNINIQDLINENINLKMKIQSLECSVNGLEVMIEKQQNESKQTLKQLQEYRKEKVLTNKEADLINELNSFKAHCHRVETQFVTQKLQLTEELHFYKEELRILEKLANDNREQLLKLSQDKDYFQQKYTKLKTILKQRRTGGTSSLGGTSLFPENYEIPQQQQKKKAFWIFK